jgi:hypothetical protein
MELNKEKKMKSEQAVLPNLCLEEEEEEEEEYIHRLCQPSTVDVPTLMLLFGQKSIHRKCSVGKRIVIMKSPSLCPKTAPFPTSALP